MRDVFSEQAKLCATAYRTLNVDSKHVHYFNINRLNKKCKVSHFSVNHGNHGSFDFHADGHANVEHLMVKARVNNGLSEEKKCV